MKPRRALSIIVLLLMICSSRASLSSDFSESYRIGPRDKVFSLHVSDDKRSWAVGDAGLILTSADGGETWMKVESPSGDTYALNDVTFVGKNGWIVGDSGLILYTQDEGNHWVKQVSNTTSPLMQVSFLDKKRGVIVGEEGTVLWTEDGGSLWQPSPLDWMQLLPESLIERGIYAPNLYDVFFVDEAHGWIAGDAGAVLFSADAGKSWELLQIEVFSTVYSLYFKSSRYCTTRLPLLFSWFTIRTMRIS